MTTVASHAATTPDTSTPKPHACGVKVGSWPIVRSKTHAAATDTTNWNARMTQHYSEGIA